MTSVARTGQSLVMASSTMLFAAFTSALVVRRAGGDFLPTALPVWLWATALLAPVGSWLAEKERYRLAAACGAALAGAQIGYVGTRHLGEIHQAFAAVFAGAHAVHAVAAAVALWFFGEKARLFWHFAGALWIYVLFVVGQWA